MTTSVSSWTKNEWIRRTVALASAVTVLMAPLAAFGDETREFRRGGERRLEERGDRGRGDGRRDDNRGPWRPGEIRGGGREDDRHGSWNQGGNPAGAGRWWNRGDWRAQGHRGEWLRNGGRWEWHREERRGGEYRRHWHFEPRYGWRYRPRVGVWSPFYLWWWLDGLPVLGVAPTVTILRYPAGYYALQGDGIGEPYYWTWVPTRRAPPPPPPGPPELAPESMLAEPGEERELQGSRGSGGGNEAAGTILGGAVGGVLGSTLGRGQGRIGGIIVGTLIGALLGHEIGRSVDEADELHAARVLEKNRTDQGSSWVNPDTGAEVTVVPKRTYETPAGEPCREYQTEVTVGGQKQQAYGKACRQPDGQWKIVP